MQGLPVHLDGARVFNAAVALGVNVKEITMLVTTVQFCLSKVSLYHAAMLQTMLASIMQLPCSLLHGHMTVSARKPELSRTHRGLGHQLGPL